jgi:hypothetical protein
MQVGRIDRIEFDDAEGSNAGGRQIESGRRSKTARAHAQDPGRFEAALAENADLVQRRVPAEPY